MKPRLEKRKRPLRVPKRARSLARVRRRKLAWKLRRKVKQQRRQRF
jgi:hypothetical protein